MQTGAWKFRWLVLTFGLGCASIAQVAWAGHDGSRHFDQDQARAALESGTIKPLDQILAVVRKQVPGDIVRVRLEREQGSWRYEIRVIDGKGRLREVVIDAATASVISAEGE